MFTIRGNPYLQRMFRIRGNPGLQRMFTIRGNPDLQRAAAKVKGKKHSDDGYSSASASAAKTKGKKHSDGGYSASASPDPVPRSLSQLSIVDSGNKEEQSGDVGFFSIIPEELRELYYNPPSPCEVCGKNGHWSQDCPWFEYFPPDAPFPKPPYLMVGCECGEDVLEEKKGCPNPYCLLGGSGLKVMHRPGPVFVNPNRNRKLSIGRVTLIP